MKFLNDVQISERLRSLIGVKSTREVAVGAGIDPSQFNKIIKGNLSISENILDKLCQTYGWDRNFILYGKGRIVPHETDESHLLEDPPAKYYTKKEVENDILKEQVRELEAKLAECNQEIGSLKKDLEIERSKNFSPLKKTGKAG